MEKHRTTVYIDKKMYRVFKSKCAMLGKTISEVIEELVKKEIEK